MARLLRPVMKTMWVMPAATASSTAYWMSGLSTTGSISLGLALVAGRNRVPIPATGKTALVTRFKLPPLSCAGVQQFYQPVLVEHRNAQGHGFVVLAARIRSDDHITGFL